MAKDYVKRNTDGLTNNKYFDFLVKFGFSDIFWYGPKYNINTFQR
jgi:hypothetical protein